MKSRAAESCAFSQGMNTGSRKLYWLDALQCLFLSLIVSLSWTWLTLHHLGLQMNFSEQFFFQLLLSASLILLLRYKKLFLALLGGVLFLYLFSAFTDFSPALELIFSHLFQDIRNSFLWSFAATRGDILQPATYDILLGLAASVLSIIFLWKKPLPYVLALVILIPLVTVSPEKADDPGNIIYLLLCLPVLIVAFSRYGKLRYGKQVAYLPPPLLLAAVLLAASFFIQSALPEDFFRQPELAEEMRQLQRRFGPPETVNYYEFSLRDTGYYPMGYQLGGPNQLQHHAYMKVKGPETSFYLRGAVSEDYRGNAWVGENMEPNFIFENHLMRGRQADVFQYPDEKDAQTMHLFQKTNLFISPLQHPVQVVFNGGRPYNLVMPEENQTSYYNLGGQIYNSRELTSAGYEVDDYLPKTTDLDAVISILLEKAAAGQLQMGHSDSQGLYRDILIAEDPGLFEMVYEDAPGDTSAAIHKIYRLIQYLSEHYRYELDVPYPNENEDFLNTFFRTKEGYCTYFATALTQLLREAGIRARYVEGFLVPGVDSAIQNGNQYERVISTDSAHAWTEIYFEGLGWYPFDASPGDTLQQMKTDQDEESRRNPSPTTSAPTTAPSRETPSTSPTTATSPRQQNTQNSSAPKPQTKADPASQSPLKRAWLFILLLFLLIILMAAYLYYASKRYRSRHQQESYDRLNHYPQKVILTHIWSDIKAMAELAGESFPPSRTLNESFQHLDASFPPAAPELSRAACLSLERSIYGDIILDEAEFFAVLQYYAHIEEGLKLRLPRLKWLFRRYLFPGKTASFHLRALRSRGK